MLRQENVSVLRHNEADSCKLERTIRELVAVAFNIAGVTGFSRYMVAVESACTAAFEDLKASRLRDPAIRNKPIECQLSIHSTFCAVLHYRLANALLRLNHHWEDLQIDAMRLSFSARSLTGVEIHPEAKIGARLSIDHGWGTVIGQTVQLGDDAYILNNVVLGGRAIGDAPDGKRHPTIGHRVQISSGARILGPVVIGDDCFIGSDVTLTADLPSASRIVNRSAHAIYTTTNPAIVPPTAGAEGGRCL